MNNTTQELQFEHRAAVMTLEHAVLHPQEALNLGLRSFERLRWAFMTEGMDNERTVYSRYRFILNALQDFGQR